MILKPVKQTSTAAALKAERDRDMAQAMQDYENEQWARLANMARLRALRLENVRAELTAAAPRSAKKKKVQRKPGAGHLNIGYNSGRAPLDARRLPLALAIYRTPSHARSVAELTITAAPLVTLWAAAWFAFWLGYAWATPFIAVPAAGFLLRLFMIQHDCGHGTFFSRRLANDWVGRVIGVEIPPLPAPTGDVRHRTGLSVPAATPPAGGDDAKWLATLGQYHGDQSGGRASGRGTCLAHRHQGIPARARPYHLARGQNSPP